MKINKKFLPKGEAFLYNLFLYLYFLIFYAIKMRYFFLFFFLIISSNSYSQDDTQELIISGIDAMFEKEFETSLEI